jgi:hypothetical protein
VAVGSGSGDGLAQQLQYGGGGRGGLQRRTHVEGARTGEDLDRDDAGQPVDGAPELAGGGPSHGHVVLLHRARGDRVDTGGGGEALHLRDDRGLGVLGDHVARVDPGVVGEERRQAVVARLVEEPVRAALGDRGDVGRCDGEEVEHVGDRGAVEVAVRLDAAVVEDDRVVDGRVELARRDRRGVVHRVAGRSMDLRRAAERVGVLDAVAVGAPVAGDDAGVGEDPPEVLRRGGLAGVGPQGLEVGGEDPVGAELGLDRHGGRDVRRTQDRAEVGDGHHQHAEHAVGAVDEGEPLLGGELHGLEAGGL